MNHGEIGPKGTPFATRTIIQRNEKPRGGYYKTLTFLVASLTLEGQH